MYLLKFVIIWNIEVSLNLLCPWIYSFRVNPTTDGVQILWVGGGFWSPSKKSMMEWA